MMRFTVTFTRYGNGLREMSARDDFHAPDFQGAVTIANAMLRGMAGADPANAYAIEGIAAIGYTGVRHDGYMGIWTSRPADDEGQER